MSKLQSLNFSNLDFWQLPFEKNGLFIDLEADTYGIAAAVVREALRGEGRQGKRKVRLLKALLDGDEVSLCREIAGIYRSALKNSKNRKKKKCQATERAVERNFASNAEDNGVDELFVKMADLPQVEREVAFFEFYIDSFYLFERDDWIFVAEKIDVNFERIERIAEINCPDFALSVDAKGQGAWVFEYEVAA